MFQRKTYIKLISHLLGFALGILLVWLISSITPKDTWTLTKATFAKAENIMEQVPKIEVIEEKVEKTITAKPLTWMTKKMAEETAKEVLAGNLGAISKGIRTYALIFLAFWFISLIILWAIIYYLSRWIISSFIWKETELEPEQIDI